MNPFSWSAWCWVLLLSGAALVLLALRIWFSRSKSDSLERDKTGFLKYHKDTQLLLKQRYLDALKAFDSEESKAASKEKTKIKKNERKAVAVLKFDGDLRAKQHTSFAKLVDEVVLNSKRFTEIVVQVDSPGGVVPTYGRLFAEMERLRTTNVPLTVCIDVIAASGGYLMSLPANKIIAAPFAFVGSIGVVAFVPNIRKLLTRLDINPRTFTAGRYKRTVNLTDDASPEEVAHFQSQLESIHEMFAEAVAKYRPGVKLDQVTTGDHWTAAESVRQELGLVDVLSTSGEYLLRLNRDNDLLIFGSKKNFFEESFFKISSRTIDAVENRISHAM